MGKFADRTGETSTTTGTGDFTLAGAITAYEAFSTNFALNTPFYYAITLNGGTEWEVGEGYLSASSTLVRSRVRQSSNSDALVNFSVGLKIVFNSIPASLANTVPSIGKMVAAIAGMGMP